MHHCEFIIAKNFHGITSETDRLPVNCTSPARLTAVRRARSIPSSASATWHTFPSHTVTPQTSKFELLDKTLLSKVVERVLAKHHM